MSVTEQRYKAVLAVIADGRTVGEVASQWGVCRQTMRRWLARYESDGLEGLGNRSYRPVHLWIWASRVQVPLATPNRYF
jgi:transposase-like protein